MFRVLFLLVFLFVRETVCNQAEDNPSVLPSRESALASYKVLCDRIQDLADWLSLVLKMKSLWSRSTSIGKQRQLNIPVNTEEIPRMNEKFDRTGEYSCASLKNLHLSAQTYVKWQTELMKAKAMTGGNFFMNRVIKMNETGDPLKYLRNRLLDLGILNRTSNDILQTLKLGEQALASQLEEQRNQTFNLLQEVGRANDFLGFLQGAKETLLNQVYNLVQTSEGLKKTQDSLKQGELLQQLGNALDTHTISSLTELAEKDLDSPE